MTTPPIATHLTAIILRDLRALRREVEAYPSDESVWATPPGIANSCGTLVLHLVGNLRLYVGSGIGGIDYERDRPREFAARGIPRAELLREIEVTIDTVERAFQRLNEDHLAREFALPISAGYLNTQEFLLHCAVHLGYHLGQVDYHRRLTTGMAVTVSTLSSAELSTVRPAPTG